jgi:hypothetical protein
MTTRATIRNEEDFVRAYHDLMVDIMEDRTILIMADFSLTNQKGVLKFSWEVFALLEGHESEKPLTAYHAFYPNSKSASMGAFLFQCATRLAHLVESSLGAYETR